MTEVYRYDENGCLEVADRVLVPVRLPFQIEDEINIFKVEYYG